MATENFAQQHFDVAVVARAHPHRALADVVHARVADVGPVGGIALHQRYSAGGSRPMLERRCGAQRHHVVVRPADGEVQEAQRVEHRVGQRPERVQQGLARHLGGTRTIGVTAGARVPPATIWPLAGSTTSPNALTATMAPTMTPRPSVGGRLAPLVSDVPPSVTPW